MGRGKELIIGVVSVNWVFVFFFSSRRRHTRLQGDWSSDVCSSDLSSDLVADIILGLSAQPAEREDAVIVEDLLGKQRGDRKSVV